MADKVLDELNKLLEDVETLRPSVSKQTPPVNSNAVKDKPLIESAPNKHKINEEVDKSTQNKSVAVFGDGDTHRDVLLPEELDQPSSIFVITEDLEEDSLQVHPIQELEELEQINTSKTDGNMVTRQLPCNRNPISSANLNSPPPLPAKESDNISAQKESETNANRTRPLYSVPNKDIPNGTDVLELEDIPVVIPPQPEDEFLKPGTKISVYVIETILSRGGMAEVYLAHHTALGKKVCLKRLSPQFAREPRWVERFLVEGRRASQIHHPNVIEINDLVSIEDNHFLVMEYLPGESLEDRIKRVHALSFSDILNIGEQLCDALLAVHAAHIVHRDLKPSNVFLDTGTNTGEHVKLLDFGIAKLVAESLDSGAFRTGTGVMIGTPGYMAPEQIAGDNIDYRADIYCVGLILFEMVTGERPFSGSTYSQLLYQHATSLPTPPDRINRQNCPGPLADLIMQCLEKDPNKRPQSMEEVKTRLLDCEDSDRKIAYGRSNTFKFISFVLLLLAVIVAAYFAYSFIEPQSAQKINIFGGIMSKTHENIESANIEIKPEKIIDTNSEAKSSTEEIKNDDKKIKNKNANETTKTNSIAPSPTSNSNAGKSKKPAHKRRPRKTNSNSGSFFDRY
ncbi:MAG: serine/threonine protein kinase [Deltaproteobacteria bacterium]|nr:serine/threonine protein kinase [Deltaproteobacteria bacterium]